MIKGIHRQMIEITHTGSPYFERAFLVVRAGCQQPAPERLHSQAEKVVEQAGTYAGIKRRRRRNRLQKWGALAASGGLGAAAMWALLQVAR